MNSKVPALTHNELVNISIRAARYVAGNSAYLSFTAGNGGTISIENGANGVEITRVEITRVAPAEWPPETGDIWADANGDEWVTTASDGETILMRGIEVDGDALDSLDVLYSYGPMRLVRRRGWTPAAPEPEQVDERETYTAGLHEMAYWLTANPGVHLPYLGFGGSTELQQQDVQAVPIFADTYGDDPRAQMLAVEQAMGDKAIRRVERDRALVWRRFGAIALVASADVDKVGADWVPADTRLSYDEALADAFPEPDTTGASVLDCDDACEDERVAAGTCRHTDGW